MKIAEYRQMMAYLMRPKYQRGGYVRLKNGGRIGFNKGGAADVRKYLKGLKKDEDEDLIIISDIDEIPDLSKIYLIKQYKF